MSATKIQKLAVLGAGSWGTALSILFAKNGVQTRMWGHLHDHIEVLQNDRENKEFLPGFALPEKLEPCFTLDESLQDCNDVLVVVPSHVFRDVLLQLKDKLPSHARIAWATKGLGDGSTKLLHQNVIEIFGKDHPMAVISGPTFAKEVAAGLPTALTIASNNETFANDLAITMCNESFRAYTATDIAGVELGGAVKNVLAIAAGIADGLGFGANTRAALITRGLHEIMRLGKELGGHPETFMGLAGMGDLVLTCTDNQSRNRRFGIALAEGKSIEKAQQEIGQVVEGYMTAKKVNRLANELGVDMPITQQVYRALYEDIDPREAVHELFARELKPELD